MDNRFLKQYLHLLYENKQYKDFLNAYFECLQNDKFKFIYPQQLVFQSKQNIFDIPIDFILEIVNSTDNILIFYDYQIKKFFENSQHFKHLKNKSLSPLMTTKFKFDNYNEIDKFHYNLGVQISEIELARNIFKNKVPKQCCGFYNVQQNFIFLNTNYSNQQLKKTCFHQLSHYVQQRTGTFLKPSINKKKFSNIQLVKHLQISQMRLKYIFNQKQFYTILDDLITNLKEVHLKYYSKLGKCEFLNMFIQKFSTKNKNILDDIFIQQYISIQNDLNGIILFICSYILHIKYHLICQILRKKICGF